MYRCRFNCRKYSSDLASFNHLLCVASDGELKLDISQYSLALHLYRRIELSDLSRDVNVIDLDFRDRQN